MTPERGQRVYVVFEAALKCDPAGRSAVLEELCAGDTELRAEVQLLLAQDAEAERGRFMASPASTEQEAKGPDTSTEGKSEVYWSQSLEGTRASAPISASTSPSGLAEHPDYVIKRELGRGGMGVVYLAENRLMGRNEVLKVIGREIMERAGALERFLREIRAVAKLRHPNIVTAYHAPRVGDSIVFAMEYVEGLDLSRMVKARGPLPVSSACYYVHQAALGLQHAHEHGMVHRDIKPSNLMLARQGDRDMVKVLDFGLAKVRSEGQTDGSVTYEGQMLGTPDFIAPEQISDARQADIRADIYSLGATLYYLLTGGPPFRGSSLYDIFHGHKSMEATPLNLTRPEVPVELAAVVAKMMAKEPELRFQIPAEVARALDPFREPGANPGPGPGHGIASVAPVAASVDRAGGGSAAAQPAHLSDPSSTAAPRPQLNITPKVARGPRALGFRALAAAGVLLLALIAASVVIVRTKNGTIVFENLPEASVVTIDGNMATVEWPKGKGTGQAQVTIPPGTHYVEVNTNGVRVTGKEVSFASARLTPIVVRLETPPEPARSPGPRTPVLDSTSKRVKNSVGMTLVLIHPGEFKMGSNYGPPGEDDRPPHQVQISHSFYLSAHEATQKQYEAITDANPSHFSGRPKNPVDDLTWIDAVTFCNKLSLRETQFPYYRIVDVNNVTILGGNGYRLPTEAEWEYACRAGDSNDMPFHDDGPLGRFAWMWSNCGRVTHPVGEKEPNAFGLYDIYGNVWEWCWDWIGPYPAGLAIDPTGPPSGTYRTLRGNGWWNGASEACRPSFRLRGLPDKTSPNHDFGFRVAAGGAGGLPIIAADSPADSPAGKP